MAALWFGIRRRVWPVAVVLSIALGVVAYTTSASWIPVVAEQAVVQRFEQHKKHDSFAGRGYDRPVNYPEYLIFGAGEGGFERFPKSAAGSMDEIHSSFATLLFGYGIVGTVIFGLMLLRIFSGIGRRQAWRHVGLAMPLAVYGLAHQGMRTTILWIFLGIVLSRKWTTKPCG